MGSTRLLSTLVACCFLFSSAYSQLEIDWQRSYGGSDHESGNAIVATSDGGFAITGTTYSSDGHISGFKGGLMDAWVIKLDMHGDLEWERTYGGSGIEKGYAIYQTGDGGYVVTGITNSQDGDLAGINFTGANLWVLKIDSTGNIQWQNCLGGSNSEVGRSIVQTNDGGYLVAGSTNSNDGHVTGYHFGGDAWVVKLDVSGSLEWQKCYGGSDGDAGWAIDEALDGYFITATSESDDGDLTGNQGDRDFWILKIDTVGMILWQKNYGGSKKDEPNSIKSTNDGGCIVLGSTDSYNGDISGKHSNRDIWMVKLDSSGTLSWQNCLGGSGWEYGQSVLQNNEGDYIFAGWTNSNNYDVQINLGSNDYWMGKVDQSGNLIWEKSFGGPEDERIYGVTQSLEDGSYVITGFTYSSSYDVTNNFGLDDVWNIKVHEHYNSITGKAYIDLDSNSVQGVNEQSLRNHGIIENTTGRISYTDAKGQYFLAVLDSGNYEVNPIQFLNYFAPHPPDHQVYFPFILQTDSLNDFGYQINQQVNDLCVSVTAVTQFRAGMQSTYVINYHNAGTTNLNPTIVFYPDPNISFVTSDSLPSTITNDSIAWNIGNLSPFQSGRIVITVAVDLNVPVGTLITSSAAILPVAGDQNPNCNYSTAIPPPVTGSFDPNDIQVNRDTIFDYELFTPLELVYTIRFQNTGNDTAFYVRVSNNIPESLDLNSFTLVASSHSVDLDFQHHSRLMNFVLEDILLPDSIVNEPMSHGFIKYRIKPNSTLNVGDTISNSALIYFDFNSPVLTNNAITEVVSLTSEFETEIAGFNFNIYPNPATEFFITEMILLQPQSVSVRLFGILGNLVYENQFDLDNGKQSIKIPVTGLSDGFYVLRISTGNRDYTGKVIIRNE